MDVPAGAESLDVAIGNVSDAAADLDLAVYDAAGNQVGQSADGDSEESVSLAGPAAGTYTVEVVGYSVPAGHDRVRLPGRVLRAALGEVTVDESTPVKLGTGDSTDGRRAGRRRRGRRRRAVSSSAQVQLLNARRHGRRVRQREDREGRAVAFTALRGSPGVSEAV